jgi:siderophore synthetase component
MNKTGLITNESITKTVFKASRVLETSRWQDVNKAFICKSLAELMHELLITPVVLKQEDKLSWFKLACDLEGIYYCFRGTHKAMDYWVIEPASIRKIKDGIETDELNAVDFFISLQHTIGITSHNLTRFTEEVYKSLYADCFIDARRKLTADELADATYQQVEQQMDGHPWLIMNKGRIGFNYTDYTQYAPEAGNTVKLLWLAVSRSMATFNCMDHLSYDQLISTELDEESIDHFNESLVLNGVKPGNYFFMPVHEWQWNNKLLFLFANEIAEKNIIPITYSDDSYFAQQSIRTLFNVSHPKKHYVKTALSILNTTLYRGLSADKLKVAPMMAKWVSAILNKDAYLKETGFVLLNEVATMSYPHPHFKQITGAPYQYNEMLGVIWRESVMKHADDQEKPFSMASLLYIDVHKKPLLAAFIEKSGLRTEQWVKAYLQAYLQPLIHCFYKHQMFFVPHGENVILLFKDYVPTRMVLKDFVEEVQLMPEAFHKVEPDIRNVLYEIPEEDVTLFIFTDIFDGFFRYFSSILSTHLQYDEQLFWKQVADLINAYQVEFPDLESIYKKYDLFATDFRRFCLNRFRLVTSGYQESADAPAIPPFAGILQNPISVFRK